MYFSLCVLDNPSAPEQEECFQDLKLVDGSTKFNVQPETNNIENRLVLPAGLVCERCVLRWTYTAGNWDDDILKVAWYTYILFLFRKQLGTMWRWYFSNRLWATRDIQILCWYNYSLIIDIKICKNKILTTVEHISLFFYLIFGCCNKYISYRRFAKLGVL